MLHRLTLLFVLLQCGGPPQVSSVDNSDFTASYMKYVPGAGGGKGIIFKVSSSDSIPDLTVSGFVVNGYTLPAQILYRQGKTIIEASEFYQEPEQTVPGKETTWTTPLYTATSYSAVIHFEIDGKADSLRITDFQQEESPMYP